MKRPSAYQNRLQEIRYLDQRSKELEAIVEAMAQKLNNAGMPCVPSLAGGIHGDHFITDVNNGEFGERIVARLRRETKLSIALLPESKGKQDVIEKLWEDAGHGTRRQDVEAAYAAGVDACLLIAQGIHAEAEKVAHPDAAFWTAKCVGRIKGIT